MNQREEQALRSAKRILVSMGDGSPLMLFGIPAKHFTREEVEKILYAYVMHERRMLSDGGG